MSGFEDEDENLYKVFGLFGVNSIFMPRFCQTDRTWRRQLLITNDKMQKNEDHPFDECKNAFVKPRPAEFLDILENLHKKSDYE